MEAKEAKQDNIPADKKPASVLNNSDIMEKSANLTGQEESGNENLIDRPSLPKSNSGNTLARVDADTRFDADKQFELT